jgi:hypothetical protein
VIICGANVAGVGHGLVAVGLSDPMKGVGVVGESTGSFVLIP